MLNLLAQTVAQVAPVPSPNVINATIQMPAEGLWGTVKDILSVVIPVIAGLVGAHLGAKQAQKAIDRQIAAAEHQQEEARNNELTLRRKGLFADSAIAAQRYISHCNIMAIKQNVWLALKARIDSGKGYSKDKENLDDLSDVIQNELEKRINYKHDLEVARLRLVAHTDQKTYDEVNDLHQKVINIKTSSTSGERVDINALRESCDQLAHDIDSWAATKCFSV